MMQHAESSESSKQIKSNKKKDTTNKLTCVRTVTLLWDGYSRDKQVEMECVK